jgi:hypothetical protein
VREAEVPFDHATAVSLHVAVRENHGRATAGKALRGGFDKLSPNGPLLGSPWACSIAWHELAQPSGMSLLHHSV